MFVVIIRLYDQRHLREGIYIYIYYQINFEFSSVGVCLPPFRSRISNSALVLILLLMTAGFDSDGSGGWALCVEIGCCITVMDSSLGPGESGVPSPGLIVLLCRAD